ncbi:membrane integrity-associated transporter subunit PqiC [Methylobacterium sp. 37f]|nr:membrane integrity-associated transporter subunit PqiC [Methylobacterium sp. 37f]
MSITNTAMGFRAAPAQVRGLLAVMLLAAGLGGCGGGAVPLTFDLAALPPNGRVGGTARSFVVTEPTGLQPFEADRIIVREPGGALSFLGGGQWADRLPRLIQARLIQSLENSGRLKSVSRPGDKITAEYQLISEIRAFDIAAGSGEAVVDISAKIIAEGTGKVVAARIFTARLPVSKVDAANAAVGLDAALARVLADMVAWVNSGR